METSHSTGGKDGKFSWVFSSSIMVCYILEAQCTNSWPAPLQSRGLGLGLTEGGAVDS